MNTTPKPEEQVEVKPLNSAPASVPAGQKPSVPASLALGQAVGDSVQSILQEDPNNGFFITDDELQELKKHGFGWLKDKTFSWGMPPKNSLVFLVGPKPDSKKAIARITEINFCPMQTLKGDVHVDIVH